MRKIFFLSFIFISLITPILAEQNNLKKKTYGCIYQASENYLKKINSRKIIKIEVDVNNYKKWTVNNIKILTSSTRFISNDLKKNFNGKVKVYFDNNLECIFKARIRHSGDAKDHIALKNNSVIQSLDIRLKNGNIKGITKFKLFKPDVRGNLEDVIIQNQILRNMNYLAPRSYKVQARVNETNSVMLFQEKASKELLEFNNRREGPILEGDQNFFFELVKNIPDNNLSNWSVGTPFLRNKSSKVMLSKLTNANLITRGNVHKQISLDAINKLNLIYLNWSNRFQDEKNNFFFFDYDLDNNLLSFFDNNKTINLEIYNLFMQSTNSQHALSSSNRKFYWNSIEHYFEPIVYDANPNIDLNFSTTTTAISRLPVTRHLNDAFNKLNNILTNININNLHEQVKSSGLDLSKEKLEKKIIKIIKNLKIVKKNYDQNLNEEIILHNNFKIINNILDKFNENIAEIDSDAYLVKYDGFDFYKCKIYLKDCKILKILDEDLIKLLEGELKIKKNHYQFIGNKIDLNYLNKKEEFNFKKFLGTKIYYDNNVEVKTNIESNTIQINQKKIGGRAFVIDGILKETTIIFNGIEFLEKFRNNPSLKPPNFPINNKGLTGCLSLINLNLENINISANNSSCEDTINFIGSTGTINQIFIQNSFSDALDIDYSSLKIGYIEISTAINDCTDFSSGQYELKSLILKNCGDKGISVGEKSNVQIDDIKIDQADIGIASKDSSIIKLNKATLKNLRTCVSAYNKKQEFDGGFIKINEIKCENFLKKFDIDSLSKVLTDKDQSKLN